MQRVVLGRSVVNLRAKRIPLDSPMRRCQLSYNIDFANKDS